MRKTWSSPRGVQLHAIVDLSVAAVLIVLSTILLLAGNRGGIFTLVLGVVALIAGCIALYVLVTMPRETDADQPSEVTS
jgi:Zn-dependent membrane protease YugP